jgi:ribonuclease Y
MISSENIVEICAALAVGAAGGYWLLRWREKQLSEALAIKEKAIVDNAQRQAETLLRESKLSANEEIFKLRADAETQLNLRRQEIASTEQRLNQLESGLKTRSAEVDETGRKSSLRLQQAEALLLANDQLRSELLEEKNRQKERLAALAHLTEADARNMLLKQVEEESAHDASILTRNILDDAKIKAEEKARRIICLALQRYAGEHTFETSTATVALNGDDIKGRIIGREGRNIRAFEAATGTTVLIDDTPNAVVLSGFDPVRREIAREAMERLILDGRIHPTRIEEVVLKVSQEIDEAIMRAGEAALHKLNLPPMHPEVVKLLGRLKFRHSFSQNVLDHSIEVGHLMGLMASELGIDIASAKRAGLLHDIGKAVNHEIEGAHAIVGAEILKRYGESDDVINGVASHHDEVPHTGILGILVSAADAMSASRPGARSETMTIYIKRVEDLERIGNSFPGVEKCYAVQAGRELRVIVQPDKVTDEQAFQMARNLSRKIEEELQYPGQIRVTVVRETRCIEFAK